MRVHAWKVGFSVLVATRPPGQYFSRSSCELGGEYGFSVRGGRASLHAVYESGGVLQNVSDNSGERALRGGRPHCKGHGAPVS